MKVIIKVNQLPNEREPRLYNGDVFYASIGAQNTLYMEADEITFPLGKVKAKVWFYTRKPEDRDEMAKLFRSGILGLIRSRTIDKIEDIEITDILVYVDEVLAPLTVIYLEEAERV